MTSIINATTTSGLAFTADQSGILALQNAGSNALVLTSTNASVVGNVSTGGIVSATGNITGGNILTSGILSATGNVTAAGNLIAGNSRVTVQSTGVVLKPYTPAFFATGNGGGVTVNIGNYFPFNTLNTTFAGSNRNSGFNTGTYIYTAPVAGLYYFYAQVWYQSAGQPAWFKNGVQQSYNDAASITYYSYPGSASILIGGSVLFDLAAGDTVGLQPRGATNNIACYMGHSSFFGYLIG